MKPRRRFSPRSNIHRKWWFTAKTLPAKTSRCERSRATTRVWTRRTALPWMRKTGCCSSTPGDITATSDVAGTGKWFPPAIKVYAAGCQRRRQAFAGDYRRQDATGLAGGDEVQSGQRRSVRGERHRPIDAGVSRMRAKADGDVAPARAIHGPSTRLRNPTGVALDLEEQRGVGLESGELFGDSLSADGRRRRGTAADHSQRGREQARSEFREDRGGHLRSRSARKSWYRIE